MCRIGHTDNDGVIWVFLTFEIKSATGKEVVCCRKQLTFVGAVETGPGNVEHKAKKRKF